MNLILSTTSNVPLNVKRTNLKLLLLIVHVSSYLSVCFISINTHEINDSCPIVFDIRIKYLRVIKRSFIIT